MTRTRQLAMGATALALTSVLAACGSSNSGGSSATPGGGSASAGGASAGSGSSCTVISGSTTTVQIKDFAFHPSCISVAVGTKVTFTNADSTTHTATDSSSGGFDSGNLSQSQTFTQTFMTAGTFNYLCSIHQYMRGTVVVRS